MLCHHLPREMGKKEAEFEHQGWPSRSKCHPFVILVVKTKDVCTCVQHAYKYRHARDTCSNRPAEDEARSRFERGRLGARAPAPGESSIYDSVPEENDGLVPRRRNPADNACR